MDQDLETIEVNTATSREGVTFALFPRHKRSFPLATLDRITMCDGSGGATVLANEVMLFEVVNLLTGNAAWEAAEFKEYEERPEDDRVLAIVKGPGPHPTIEELISTSSLRTSRVVASRAPPEMVEKIVKRANSLAGLPKLPSVSGPTNAYHVDTQLGKLRAVRVIMGALNAVADEFETRGRMAPGPQRIETAHHMRGVNDGFRQAAQVLRDVVTQLGQMF